MAYNTGFSYRVLDSSIASQTISANRGYIATNNSSLVVFTLPLPGIRAGDMFAIGGFGSMGWQIAQNAGQSISFGNKTTTVGTAGSLSSTNNTDSLTVVCITDNAEFLVVNSIGNLILT